MGCVHDGRAVPPHIGEGFLAGQFGLFGGVDNALHQLQVPPAELQLVRDKPVQQLTVMGLVPTHGATVYCKTAAAQMQEKHHVSIV